MLLPSKFIPQTASDFVGPAANVAQRMMRFIQHSRQTGDPIAFLLTGQPGIGKTALARFTGQQLGITGCLLEPLNGTQLTIERVEEISSRLHYRPMFGDWHFIFVDEFEFVTNGAKARLLTLLNELPKWTAFDCDAIHFENDLGEEIPEGKALQKMNRAFLMHDMVQPPKPLTKRGRAALLRNSDQSS